MFFPTCLLHFIVCIILFNTSGSEILTTSNLPKKTQDLSGGHELETKSLARTRTMFKENEEHGKDRKESLSASPFNLTSTTTSPDHHEDQKESNFSIQHSPKGRSRIARFLVFLLPRSGPFSSGIFHRRDRFYYCGPKKNNSCRSLCYAYGYPKIECGRISCYCTW